MKRNNITYIKPQDPSFLAKLKAQIGYQEGPDLESKRPKAEVAGGDSDSDSTAERPEREDEKPQIVVLRSGDLSADEVAKEEARIALEAATTPADLSKPIVFKKRSKAKETQEAPTKGDDSSRNTNTTAAIPHTSKQKISKKESSAKLLSFNFDDDDKVDEED